VAADISRVALVTGSGKQRIGWHVARALASRGCAIGVHYLSSADSAHTAVQTLRDSGVDARAFRADLSVEGDARGLVRAVVDSFGRIDVLVNAAAIWGSKPFDAVTADDLRKNFDVNVLATFVCAQEAGLAMVKQPEGGCIINFGDWAEARPYTGYAAYFASKGAIPALTRCLAVELGTRNPRVRVNCILPGPVMMPEDVPETERQSVINSTLAKREGTPENVCQAVVALVENDYITGVSLPVDGGRTIFAGGT
jgi:pteridine reductase